MTSPQSANTQPGYKAEKAAHFKRLRRIEGQVRGIARMVEDDKYCIDVLTQVAAVNKAMQALAVGLLRDHMSHCVVDSARADRGAGEAKVDEAIVAVERLLRA